ncbi:hypothetical protein MnBA_32490 [Marinobacterium sp. BA1]
MDQQLTFADSEFSNKRRQTRKEKFLGRMDKLIPWARLEAVIEPHYPKAGNGRRPYPLSTMLRIHCMQQWYTPPWKRRCMRSRPCGCLLDCHWTRPSPITPLS